MFTQVCTVGRVEKSQTSSGQSILRLALAYNYGKKGDDGKRPTQWLDLALFDKQADTMGQYIEKGNKICVSVKDLHIETYNDKDGNQRSKLTGYCADLQLISSPQQASAPAPAPRPAPAPKPPPAPAPAQSYDYNSEDVPF